MDQGEWGGYGGVSKDVGKEIGWTGMGDNGWIGVGDLECELPTSCDEGTCWVQNTEEVGKGSVDLYCSEIRSIGERDGEGEGGYTRERG